MTGKWGKLSFNFRPMSSSAGLDPHARGVFLMARSPRLMSWFVVKHFFIINLTVFTDASAKPLERGYLGDDVLWSKFHSLVNFLNM